MKIFFDAKNYLGRFINIQDLLDNRKSVPLLSSTQDLEKLSCAESKSLELDIFEPGMPDQFFPDFLSALNQGMPTSVNEYLNNPEVRSKLHV